MLKYLCCEALLQLKSLQSEYLIQVQWFSILKKEKKKKKYNGLTEESKKFFVKEIYIWYFIITATHYFTFLFSSNKSRSTTFIAIVDVTWPVVIDAL